jgi:His-Xaa-Ser system protein HxsD
MSFAELGQVTMDDRHTCASILLNKQVYSKGAVLRACYWLSRDLHFGIDEQEHHFTITAGLRTIQASLTHPKPAKLEDLLPEFFDALLDSQLRIDIQQETASVRELIIAKAFAESGVLEDPPPGTFEDPVATRNSTGHDLVQISPNKDR